MPENVTVAEGACIYLEEIYSGITVIPENSREEEKVVVEIMKRVSEELTGTRPRRYAIGLALDFLAVAQKLEPRHAFEPGLTEENLFRRFPLVESRGDTKANTLSFRTSSGTIGIRAEEERVRKMFYADGRTQYPSAYVYNTGQWSKYKDLLVKCFSLSSAGRHKAAKLVIELGLDKIGKNEMLTQPLEDKNNYVRVLQGFPRSNRGENGGSIWQAMCFAFLAADRPHLHVVCSGTRTGSRRQSRVGDIDCFSGQLLALTVEVKDIAITKSNFDHQLLEFETSVSDNGLRGLVIAQSFDQYSIDRLGNANINTMDVRQLVYLVSHWDSDKQDAAIKSMLFFLYHVEANQDSAIRLEEYLG